MRLPVGSEPWTADDCVAWLWLLAHTTQANDFSFDAYIEADRRDANLMLKAQQQRQWLETKHGGLLPPWFLPFEWDSGPVGGDITRFV